MSPTALAIFSLAAFVLSLAGLLLAEADDLRSAVRRWSRGARELSRNER
jgi:hypothetical protein